MSDCRRFNGHRAAKAAFQRHDVRASLRRAIEQIKRAAPSSFDAPKTAPTRQEVTRGQP